MSDIERVQSRAQGIQDFDFQIGCKCSTTWFINSWYFCARTHVIRFELPTFSRVNTCYEKSTTRDLYFRGLSCLVTG